MNPSAPHKKKLVVGVASVGGGDHVGIRGPPKGREGKWRGHFLSFFLGWLVIGLVGGMRSPSKQRHCEGELASHVIGGWPVCGPHSWPTTGLASFIYRTFLSGHHERVSLWTPPPKKKPNNLSLSLALSLPSRKLITRRLQVSTCYLQDALYSCWMNEKCALVCNKNSFLVWENNE